MNIMGYYRVSTEEQKRFGLSVETQIAKVRAWAEKNGHIIVGEYNDAGISGRKPISKRKQLQQMLIDLEFLHVDLIVFTRLDRWFRSVKEYYKVQDVLDRHKIAWKAIDEDYETETASGRMKVNIMLAVAENEADKTAERIKSVFDHKIANGEWVAPQGLPIGYSMENKKIVPNSDAEAVRAAFQYYADNHSVLATADYLRAEWGVDCMTTPLRRILKNRLYLGEYRDNPSFCQPIVPQDLFDRVQEEMTRRSIRHNKSGRVYLFAGLCRCPLCGHALGGMTTRRNGHEYQNYRCTNAVLNHRCANITHISEKKIEEYLLDNIAPELNRLIEQTQAEYQPKEKPKKKETVNIQAKLDRLRDLYVDGLIDKAQYCAKRGELLASMPQPVIEPKKPDYAALRELMGKDFRTRYGLLEASQQRALWRTLIDHIDIDRNRNIRFFFKP